MHPYRDAPPRPMLVAVKRPRLHVSDLVMERATGRVGRITMIERDGPVYVVAFASDSCGLFFRTQILKLAR